MRLAFALAVLLVGGTAEAPAAAQQQQPVDPATGSQQSSDVIVEGRRVPHIKTPTQIVPDTNTGTVGTRQSLDKADIFARCANIKPEVLREILDAPPNLASTRFAQGLAVSKHITCHLPGARAPMDPAEAGTSRFHRGALIEQAFARYVPDLSLTWEQTHDPAVQGRFNARESARNRWRTVDDYRLFEIAVCMVREAPGYAVDLVRSPINSKEQADYQAAIIGTARICVGYARKVVVNGTLFRITIDDALWRWVEAARGVDSLIPVSSE